MGIAGVPEAGFISLALVLTTIGISTENLALLLSVDWILGRARSATNVLSDMVVSVVVDDRRAPATRAVESAASSS
jgi:DAACS family dicarboxylate/amino acid:cation (Na+ or H+) symporter